VQNAEFKFKKMRKNGEKGGKNKRNRETIGAEFSSSRILHSFSINSEKRKNILERKEYE